MCKEGTVPEPICLAKMDSLGAKLRFRVYGPANIETLPSKRLTQSPCPPGEWDWLPPDQPRQN